MAPKQYASTQPSNFHNHISNIAIVGAGGNVGQHIAEALISTGKHKVTALTRPDSTNTMPSGISSTKHVNYDSRLSLVEALRGQDALVITMSVFAPKESQERLIDAAVEAEVKYILPNEWGVNHADKGVGKDTMLGERLLGTRDYIAKSGGEKTKFLGIICGFWYEYSLGGREIRYGFDFPNKKLTLFNDGNTKIIHSTWPQVGRAVANLLSLKILPEDERDKSPTISQFANGSVYISSFFASQRDMLASVLRVTGDKEEDWTFSREDVKERYARGVKEMKEGSMDGFGTLLYSRIFYPDGSGDFREHLDNKVLGLPEEDFDEATAEAIKRAMAGGAPY